MEGGGSGGRFLTLISRDRQNPEASVLKDSVSQSLGFGGTQHPEKPKSFSENDEAYLSFARFPRANIPNAGMWTGIISIRQGCHCGQRES